jgi:hypothetical protein
MSISISMSMFIFLDKKLVNRTLSGVMLPLGDPSPTKANPGESGGVIGKPLVMGEASGV